uniref:Reverse transcriptase domain-containing protein n=1 Tax=Tanacetum cinerariifolium TaxID=118510 RepID=A0A6L2NFQ5_TANCI|nr:reverse transcriptase domain-containing protein [Tanacetum cinerariifolium]
MASESSPQQQPKLTPASNIHFEFLLNSCVSTALTKQPSAYYLKYLREFWYTAEVESATNTITFTLSNFDKPLSFNLAEFSSVIGLNNTKNFSPLPQKEMVRATLATLGLVDVNNPEISSTDLGSHNQLNINQQMIAYGLCWGLDIDIAGILFSDLVTKLTTGKKGIDRNICYTRYLSIIIEHLLGEAYNNKNLKSMKPHHITASTFKPLTASEVTLTSYMRKVAKLSKHPEKPLILPSKEVNTNTTTDKSLSGTTVQHGVQSKAITDNKSKEKEWIITPRLLRGGEWRPPTSLQNNLFSTNNFIQVQENFVDEDVHVVKENEDDDELTDSGIRSLGNVTFKELYGKAEESPYDTESEIKVVKRLNLKQSNDDDQIKFMGRVYSDMKDDTEAQGDGIEITLTDQVMQEADSDLDSMPKDEVEFVFEFEKVESDDDENDKAESNVVLSKSKEATADNVLDELADMATYENVNFNAFANKPSLLVADAFEEKISKLLSDTLKNILPHIIKDFVNQDLPKFDKRVKKTLYAEIPELLIKPLNNAFNLLNKKECNREKTSTQENKDSEIPDSAPAQGEQQLINNTPELATAEEAKADAQGEQSSEQAPPISTVPVVHSSEEKEDVNPFGEENLRFYGKHHDNHLLTKEIESEPIIWDIGMRRRRRSILLLTSIQVYKNLSCWWKRNRVPFTTLIEDESEVIYDTDGNDADDSLEFELLHLDQGESLVIQWVLSVVPSKSIDDDSWHRNNIFRMKCNSKDMACNMINDGGSSKNVVSTYMVEKLTLKTIDHPNPYQLTWLKKENAIKRISRLENFILVLVLCGLFISIRIIKIPNQNQFSTSEGQMTIKEAKAQMQEIQRLALLKAEKEKSEKSEWIEVHALASKTKSKSNDILLKNLKAKFQWVKTQAVKLSIPPPPRLTAFELPLTERKVGMKRKRRSELIHEVFVKENIIVDGMQRNLTLLE